MSQQPEASAASPAPSERKKRAPRRATPKTVGKKTTAKAAGAKAGRVKRTTAAKPADAAELRSKAAVAKLEHAIDQLEQALQKPAIAETESPALAASRPVEPVLPPPAAPQLAEMGWVPAVRPALVTCVFLTVVGTLIFGYSVGYTMGSGEGPGATIAVASAAERSLPAAAEEKAEVASVPAEPAVEPEPEPAPAPPPAADVAAASSAGRLHLQVSALKSRQAATKLGRKLESEGFPVQVRETGADGLVRVLVGPVEDREQLAAMADRLREEGLKPFPKRL